MGKYQNIYLAILFNIVGQIALKWSMLQFKDFSIRPFSILKVLRLILAPYSLIGITFYAISAVFWMLALVKVPLSVAYPMLSIGYILIFFISIALFGEPFKVIRLSGVLLIAFGVYLISL